LLGLSLVALGVCVFTILMPARAEARSRAQSRQAFEVMQVLNGLAVNMPEAESNQRGYLLTGDDAYLSPFRQSLPDHQVHMSAYRDLTSQTLIPARKAGFGELEAWTGLKIRQLEATTTMFGNGAAADAVLVVRSDAGRTAMENIRLSAAALIAIEQSLLIQGRDKAQRARLLVLACVTLLSLLSLLGFALALRNLQRSEKLDLVEEQARQLTEERERTDLLARELNHRVKNLFAIVQSIISSTARQETDAGTAAAKIRERVYALSRAHSLTSSIDMQQQTTLAALMDAIVASQIKDYCNVHIEGPEVTVMAQHVTPLGMILHELTTNAMKYGAGACEDGHISVTWTIEPENSGQELAILWKEICPPDMTLATPGPDGFGSRMMAISLSQLRGESRKSWKPEGLEKEIFLPLDDHGAVKDRNKTET
jgi:two-component sensor histidine kinase/CHASE3 domain sensor protein